MESKLGLNFELVNRARASAAKIADDTQHFIDQHTTVTVERAVCRLLGIDGVNDMDVPLPNVVVDHLMANSRVGYRQRYGGDRQGSPGRGRCREQRRAGPEQGPRPLRCGDPRRYHPRGERYRGPHQQERRQA